jgi:hypothetical protein
VAHDQYHQRMLSDVRVHVKVKLAALWTSVMMCYVYGDLFGFFRTDLLRDVVAGRAGWIGTQGGLLVAAIIVAIPSVMIVLSIVLAARASRVANLVVGALYAVVVVATVAGSWWYYIFLSAIEFALTIVILWVAWRWPRDPA